MPDIINQNANKFLDAEGLAQVWGLTKAQIDKVVLQGTYKSETSFQDDDGEEFETSLHKIYVDKESHLLYTWDGEKYVTAKYDASNIFFTKDLIYTDAIGWREKPSSGSGTITATGKSVEQVLSDILAKEAKGTLTNVSSSLSLTGASSEVEVGTKFTPSYSCTFNPGRYLYGPATGVLTTNTAFTDSRGYSSTSMSGSFEEVLIVDYDAPVGTLNVVKNSYRVTGVLDYTAGAWAITNLGNLPESGELAQRIEAGRLTPSSNTVTCYRKMFYGYTNTWPSNSDNIRSLSGSKKNGAGDISFNEDKTSSYIVIAAPKGTRTLTKAIMPSSSDAEVTGLFVKQPTPISVLGANGADAKEYDVWIYSPAEMGGSYKITFA